jgi:hypothetical protein
MTLQSSGAVRQPASSLVSGTRDAVESAIELAKAHVGGSWESLARLLPKRIGKWGAERPVEGPPVKSNDDCVQEGDS